MEAKAIILRTESERRRAIMLIQNAPLLDAKGMPMVVVVKRRSRKRTLPMNAYWHVLFKIMGDELGYTLIEMKEAVKRALLPTVERVDPITGEIYQVSKRTRDLTVEEGIQFTNGILTLMSEQLQIRPPPKEAPEAYEIYEALQASDMREAA